MKSKNRYNPEILAPAGSFESLRAAIDAGCNAIYFGIEDMNMRATAAANFRLIDLPEIASLCHENNIKAYLALNTILYNEESEKFQHTISKAKESGIDAIIVADIAAISFAKEIDLEIHISTQVSISNTESVKFYSQFADRIVLARELSLDQVKKICDDIKKQEIKGPKGNLIEIEVFVHGALCVAVSGRCSMSLFCYNTSANRGRCTQICRRKYKVTDSETGQELIIDNNYIMSSSDLCTIGMLDELLVSGVTVLKIEGRGRGPEYVNTVVSCYKEAIQAINDGDYNEAKILMWNDRLKTVFNRGFTKGFYMGRSLDEWSGVHGNKATHEKLQVGFVEKYYPEARVVQIKITGAYPLEKGNEILITGKSYGLIRKTLENFWVDDLETSNAKQGDIVTFKLNDEVKKGDTIYLWRKKII